MQMWFLHLLLKSIPTGSNASLVKIEFGARTTRYVLVSAEITRNLNTQNVQGSI